MRAPCIIVVRYVLPAIRVLIAKEPIERHSLSLVETAEKMGLTPAALTQYIKRVNSLLGLRLLAF